MNRPILLLLILLSSLTQAAYSQQPEGSSMRLTIPKAPWTMFISGAALVLNIQKIEPDGSRGYFMLTDEKAEMFASLYIEPVNKCKTSKECRDMVWKLGNPAWQKPQNVKLSEIGEISILELLVPEYQGRPIRQHNMYAQFVVEGYWVDLHLSNVLYQDRDRPLFERMVKSVRFEPKKGDVAEDGATNVVSGKLLDPNGPIKEAEVYLNSLKDEKCAKLFSSMEYSERNLQRLKACVIEVGPIKPDENGAYKFTNLKPGYYALVVSWNLKEKFEKPIMAFQKRDFTISYFEGAKYNAVATGKVFYLSASENATKDFDYTKGEITGKIAPR